MSITRADDSTFDFVFLSIRIFSKSKNSSNRARQQKNSDATQFRENDTQIRDRDRDDRDDRDDEFAFSFSSSSSSFSFSNSFSFAFNFEPRLSISIFDFSRYTIHDDVDFAETAVRRKLQKKQMFQNRFRINNEQIIFIFINHRFVAKKIEYHDHAVNFRVVDAIREAHRKRQTKKIVVANKTRARVDKKNQI